MTQDEQYLKLLSIFHYIVAGLTVLFSCFLFIHIAIGVAMLCGAMDGVNNPPPRFLGIFFIVFPSLLIMAAWILAGLMIATGEKLKHCSSYTFCIVIAAIECILMPFGTVLGVFTIIVLMKESVKQLFEAQKAVVQHS
jgi:hypothetical protein